MASAFIIDVSATFILVGILGMFLLAVAIIVFFIQYQKKLSAQQEEIRVMETNYQRDLLNASIEAQEVERKRVATDLHDGIGSLLSAVRLYLKQLSPKKDAAKNEELLGEATFMVDTAIDQARSISHDLLPTTLDRFGVLVALEELCHRMQKIRAIQVDLSYPDTEIKLSKTQDLALYRIVQELINNTLKHARADQIQIKFTSLPDRIQMNYLDNGQGFILDDKQTARLGLGLKSIKSRVQLIEGNMQMHSEPGMGFHFEVNLEKEKLPQKTEQ